MESQQTTTTISTYSFACQALWNKWLTYIYPQRQAALKDAISSATKSFMAPLDIAFVLLPDGTSGQFGWSKWLLEVNRSLLEKKAITYEEFVDLCSTLYHESRHAEQFYRMAQGLAAGALEFPDTGETFGGQTHDRAGRIAALLDIPPKIAARAEMVRFHYKHYLALPLLPHVSVSWADEVSEWLESTYKSSRKGLGTFAQDDNSPVAMLLYKKLPEEKDAFAIEAMASQALKNRIGHLYPVNRNQPRTNVALFGN